MSSKYVTVAGDMWDYIAYKTLGGQRYMDDLINANIQYKDISIFPANIELIIPDIATPKPSSLPPWKR